MAALLPRLLRNTAADPFSLHTKRCANHQFLVSCLSQRPDQEFQEHQGLTSIAVLETENLFPPGTDPRDLIEKPSLARVYPRTVTGFKDPRQVGFDSA
jgi:hypothetical protein